MGMDQYLLIPCLGGWTSINPSYFDVGFDTLPCLFVSQDVTIKPPFEMSPVVARPPKPCVASPKRSDPMTSTRRARGKGGIEAINLAMFTVENHGKISGESPKLIWSCFVFFNGNIIGEDRRNDDIPWHAIIFWRVAYFQRRSRLK